MTLTTATVLSRSFSLAVLLLAAKYLPCFDASPRLANQRTWLLSPLFRWDTFHFQGIAEQGYAYEHQWAFLPGTPLLLRYITNGFVWVICLVLVACKSTEAIYQLTLHHFPRAPSFARLVAMLSLLSSSPTTLHFAPYAEPFFTYLSYQGMLFAAREHWIPASISFALATLFRSNGVLLSGYLVWGLVVQPFLKNREVSLTKVGSALSLSLFSCSPFLYHNYLAYSTFCNSRATTDIPPWCHQFPPSIYAHVQAKYWNVGFLKYWTLSQIPNFLLAIPPLALMIYFSVHYIITQIITFSKKSSPPPTLPLSILPHVLHTIFLCITLVFFSHTQIVLRLAASLPALYWAAAWLFVGQGGRRKGRNWSRGWIWWSCTWGVISIALWVAFLPPA